MVGAKEAVIAKLDVVLNDAEVTVPTTFVAAT
jgi:hypothetical protein